MDSQLPTLDGGVTFLDDADAPAALYRVVGRQLGDAAGPAYWVDARNAARPAAFDRHADGRVGRSLRVARAFTGYQHGELVRSLPGEVSARTSLVVAPNVAALYAEDDVPEYEADRLLAATLRYLQAVSTAVDAPVVVTTSERTPSAYRDRVRDAADRVLDAERTRAGLRVDGETFATDVYWRDWGMQTTIPYWVDLLGALDRDADPAAVDPVPAGV